MLPPAEVESRWSFIISLDEELLKGGVITSAKTDLLVQNVDIAYCNGAPLAAIILATSAIEAHLRFDLQIDESTNLASLIDRSGLAATIIEELHALRKERNRWVHPRDEVGDDWIYEDVAGLDTLDPLARSAVRLVRVVLYDSPWV